VFIVEFDQGEESLKFLQPALIKQFPEAASVALPVKLGRILRESPLQHCNKPFKPFRILKRNLLKAAVINLPELGNIVIVIFR
jgi:hypothetical protein